MFVVSLEDFVNNSCGFATVMHKNTLVGFAVQSLKYGKLKVSKCQEWTSVVVNQSLEYFVRSLEEG